MTFDQLNPDVQAAIRTLEEHAAQGDRVAALRLEAVRKALNLDPWAPTSYDRQFLAAIRIAAD